MTTTRHNHLIALCLSVLPLLDCQPVEAVLNHNNDGQDNRAPVASRAAPRALDANTLTQKRFLRIVKRQANRGEPIKLRINNMTYQWAQDFVRSLEGLKSNLRCNDQKITIDYYSVETANPINSYFSSVGIDATKL